MSGLCKDCRWWERRRSSTEWRTCLMTRTHNRDEEHPESRAVALESNDGWVDATMMTTMLVTAPTFGCNQFEARHSKP